jgi:hypothetical protein
MSPNTPRSGVPAAALLAAAGLVMVACEQRPEIRYETAHLRIGTGFDEPLCQGDLDHLELVIATVEAELSTTLDSPVDVYLWSADEWPNHTSWCPADYNSGCFVNGNIYTGPVGLDHELVHAVVRTLGTPAPFWDEGAAVALQSGRTLFAGYAPRDNLDLDTPELSYLTAGSFSRWLLETHGADLYRALLGAPGSARKAFERTYGMSFDDAQEQFFANAPYSYAPLIACEHAELEQSAALSWSETIDVNCESTDVRGGSHGMAVFRVLTIAQRGHYAFSTSAPRGGIGRCADEDLGLPPTPGDPTLGDVPPVTPVFQYGFSRTFAGEGEVTVLDLAPGRYELSALFADHEPRLTQFEVHAAPGPVPQTPESTE